MRLNSLLKAAMQTKLTSLHPADGKSNKLLCARNRFVIDNSLHKKWHGIGKIKERQFCRLITVSPWIKFFALLTVQRHWEN